MLNGFTNSVVRLCLAPTSAPVAPPAVQAWASGDAQGYILPGQPLTGSVSGGVSGQSVVHRWTADGAVIAEAVEADFTPEPGTNLNAGAAIRYAPLVDGIEATSDPVTALSHPAPFITGDTDGAVMAQTELTGGVHPDIPAALISHRWSVDGMPVAGETAPSFVPRLDVNVTQGAAITYEPVIAATAFSSAAVQVAAPVTVDVSGDIDGTVEPEQTLFGQVSGGLEGQSIMHRWTADGVLVEGETGATLTPVPGGNVPAEAVLRYAPDVGGDLHVSRGVQLNAVTVIPQSLPRLTGAQRMGAEITLDASMLSDVISRRYLVDGVEVQGQTGPSIMAAFMGALSCEVTTSEAVYVTPSLRILHNHAMESHNAMDDATLALVPHGAASHFALHDGDWSDPSIWDVGAVPGQGAVVVIPMGRAVRYDVAGEVRLDRLRIDGTLSWALDRSTDMLVETVIVQPGGHMVIGDAVDNRLPQAFTAQITFGNRAYQLDPNTPTNLDLAADPTLLGRGLLVLGAITIFGHHRSHAIPTVAGSLPRSGDSAVTLARIPDNWAVGDTIIIPGTAVDLDAQNVNHRYDEERVITAITGAQVSFDAPLLHHHDAHNDTVSDRPDLVLPIVVKDRNVVFRSEAGAAIHQRGHFMSMHGASQTDIWDAAFLEMGRTDKSIPTGIIDANGDFKYLPTDVKGNGVAVPLSASANLQSRYPVHGHFLGFGKAKTDLIRDCYVEDAKGWAGVHHGCEMDWLSNVFYRFQGSGLVAETGDELGRWDGNVVLGLETSTGKYRYPKGQEEKEGISGDFGKWGYGFFYRGRAMIVTRNTAIGATWGHVFYHRFKPNGIGDPIDNIRQRVDVLDLNIGNGSDIVEFEDYPITHFDDCVSIGCAGAVAVVKNAAAQGHDLNIKIANFLGWAVGRGIHLNYIGGYLVQDTDVIKSHFDAQLEYAEGNTNAAYIMGKTQQVAWDRIKATGFGTGIAFSLSHPPGITDEGYSQDNPRFILGHHSFTDCGVDIVGADPAEGGFVKIMDQPISYAERPSVALDFIIADYDNTARAVSNTKTALKTDTVTSLGQIPKPWDGAGLTFGSNPHIAMRGYAARHGLWDYTDDQGVSHKILLRPMYWSDWLTARSIKTMQAIKWTGSQGSYRQNGVWTRSSVPPTRADETRTVIQGTTDSFNVLEAATGGPDATLSLNIPELVDGLGTDRPAHFKANYGKIDITAAGQVSYTPIPGYTGTDRMLVYIYDGHGQFCTTEITFDVVAA